jgi:hypothetical protein
MQVSAAKRRRELRRSADASGRGVVRISLASDPPGATGSEVRRWCAGTVGQIKPQSVAGFTVKNPQR